MLNEEGQWLKWLVIAQVIKIIVFSLWHILLNRRKHGFFRDYMPNYGADEEDEDCSRFTFNHTEHGL